MQFVSGGKGKGHGGLAVGSRLAMMGTITKTFHTLNNVMWNARVYAKPGGGRRGRVGVGSTGWGASAAAWFALPAVAWPFRTSWPF